MYSAPATFSLGLDAFGDLVSIMVELWKAAAAACTVAR
jgi:hypothetical protein